MKIYNSDLIGKKQSVVDEIPLLNPHQTPLDGTSIMAVGCSRPRSAAGRGETIGCEHRRAQGPRHRAQDRQELP